MPLEEYRKSALTRGRSAEEGDNSAALSSRQSRWLSSWLFGMLFNMENDFELVLADVVEEPGYVKEQGTSAPVDLMCKGDMVC